MLPNLFTVTLNLVAAIVCGVTASSIAHTQASNRTLIFWYGLMLANCAFALLNAYKG